MHSSLSTRSSLFRRIGTGLLAVVLALAMSVPASALEGAGVANDGDAIAVDVVSQDEVRADEASNAFSEMNAGASFAVQGLQAPRRVADGVVTWDCVWLGSYPQSEVEETAALKSADWNENGDATVEGARYRRLAVDQDFFAGEASSFEESYAYFKYEPIKWRVLTIDDGKALLLTDRGLDSRPYNDDFAGVNWETCGLRTWLNHKFSSLAFSAAESNCLQSSSNQSEFSTLTTNTDSSDKVFLLSLSEVTSTRYGFSSDSFSDDRRRAYLTDYGFANSGSWPESKTTACWWFIRSGFNGSFCSLVGDKGYAAHDGPPVTSTEGVRPACWVDLASPSVTYAGTVSSDGNADDTSIKLSKPSNGNNQSQATSKKGQWIKSGSRWWYRHANGSYPAATWEKISGTWYHFDSAGWMQTGWLKDGGAWYYLASSGAMTIGWQKVGGTWYYLTSSGAMKTGWLKSGAWWYYLRADGSMATGWYKVGNTWYYADASGAMQAGKWVGNYYLRADGSMATNAWIGAYHVNANGAWDATR